jgi:hypothetical protein
MYFWQYKIEGWEENTGHYVHEGLIHGGNYTEAVDNLEDYYGNEIWSIYIECVGDKNEPYLLSQQYEINEKEVVECN